MYKDPWDEIDRRAKLMHERSMRVAIKKAGAIPMTADQFHSWLAAMKAAGLARSDAECGRLLGKSDETILSYKRRGTDIAVALACRALLEGLKPYP